MRLKDKIRELESLYVLSDKDKNVIYDIIDELKSDDIQSLKYDFLKKARDVGLISKKLLTDEEVRMILIILRCAQSVYNYTGEDTGLTDSEYDILQECIEEYSDMSVDTSAPVAASKGIITTHRYRSLRGTLDKVYYLDDNIPEEEKVNKSRRSLPDWVKSAERLIYTSTGKEIDLWNESIYVFPKWDGVSVIFEWEKDGTLRRALTRGFTETNECQDITHIFKGWLTGPITDAPQEYGEKVEAMMSNEDLDECNAIMNTNYKQTRSIVSSITNSDNVDSRIKYVKLMSLRTSMLNKDGTETQQILSPKAFDQPFIQCKLKEVDKINEFAIANREVNGLRCDGAVLYLINPEIQNMLGRKDEKQKFEVAFKFTELSTESVVKGVEFSLGLFNSVNPIAKIKKVKLKGNTIKSISLGSMGRFRKLALRVGDKVTVHYDIIPYLTLHEDSMDKDRSGKIIQPPTSCPACFEELYTNDTYEMFCTNKKCPNRIKGRALNYMNKMHIDGISYATLDLLYEYGFLKSITDLYKFEKRRHDLENLPGLGQSSVDIMINEVNNHKHVPFSQLLGSIGIAGVGRKKFKAVAQKVSMETLISDDYDKIYNELLGCSGVKELTATKIIEGLKEHRKLILKLLDILDVYEDETQGEPKFSVCFTKIRDEKMEDWITEHGGSVVDSLTKNTSILVIHMGGIQSSKVTKAQKYGIPVVTLDNLQNYITQEMSL